MMPKRDLIETRVCATSRGLYALNDDLCSPLEQRLHKLECNEPAFKLQQTFSWTEDRIVPGLYSHRATGVTTGDIPS